VPVIRRFCFNGEPGKRWTTGWDGLVSIPSRSNRLFSSPHRADRLWGPHNLLCNGYRGLFPQRESGRSVKLTTHLYLVPMSTMVEVYLHSLMYLHGMVLNNYVQGQLYLYPLSHNNTLYGESRDTKIRFILASFMWKIYEKRWFKKKQTGAYSMFT
jgi:hypothetical protein